MIIDGNGLAYRCLYSHGGYKTHTQPLGFYNEQGKYIHTGLTYGFVISLLMMIKEIKPYSIVIAWDAGSKYRQDLYPGYKSKRKKKRIEEKKVSLQIIEKEQIKHDPNYKPPHNIPKELDQIRELIHHTGIQQFRKRDEEADDLIGSLVRKFHKEYAITIASNDHDFLQLLNYEDINIFKSIGNKKEFITKKDFVRKYKILPKYYPNVLAIGGDSTDEYPGVKGISVETAFEIVKQYGPELEKILEKASNGKIESRQGKLLVEQKDMAILCQKLAKIKTKVPLWSEKTEFSESNLVNIFKKYKFHSLLFTDRMKEIKDLMKLSKIELQEPNE